MAVDTWNLTKAYQKLGLQPLDIFLDDAFQQSYSPRRIGATTWMLVTAALEVIKGNTVVLVGHTLDYSEALSTLCRTYVSTLDGVQGFKKKKRQWVRPGGGIIEWTSERIYSRSVLGKPALVFRDGDWALRTLSRAQGPYNEIRRIYRTEDRRYMAYDLGDAFLLELTREGARDILNASIRVTWDSHPKHQDPP